MRLDLFVSIIYIPQIFSTRCVKTVVRVTFFGLKNNLNYFRNDLNVIHFNVFSIIFL